MFVFARSYENALKCVKYQFAEFALLETARFCRFQVPLVLCPHQLGAVTGPTPKLLEAIFLWKFCLAFFVEQTWKTDIEENEVKKNRISDFSFFKFVPGRCAVQNSNVKMQELDSPPKGVAVHHQDSVIQNAMLAKSFAFSFFWQLLQVIGASQA